MPGAWERQPTVLCGILHVDHTSIAWALGLRNLRLHGSIMPLAGMPYDHARNTAAQQCLAGGYDWLFFLDSDVIPPAGAVEKLLSLNRPVVSGLYCRRSPPHGIPVMMRKQADGYQWVTQFNPGELVEVDVVGSGCLLIHRSVLEKFPHHRPGKPWFDWRVDLQGHLPREECLSEDYTFCKVVREKMGIPIIVDTSIRCRHVGLAQADFGIFGPCDTTPNT